MNDNLFAWLTPITYWLLVILWTVILALYVREIRGWQHTSAAMKVLLWVLAIDAIRTLFESVYFGGWYTSLLGLLPRELYDFLVKPQNVFVPKIINVLTAFIILTLLLRKWLPDLAHELEVQSAQIELNNRSQKIAHLGNWEWDIIGGDLRWSDEVFRIFGLQPQQFVATYETFLDSVHPDDRESVKGAVKQALQDPGYRYSIEHRVVRPDGELRVVQENGHVYLNQEGKPYHMSGTVLDITEQKKVEDTLVQAKETAEAANQAKSLFLSNMSHELRTPLNSILGFSRLLQDDESLPDSAQQKLQIINRSGEHLLQLINDVLDLSKIEAGHTELMTVDFDLVALVQEVSDMIRMRAEAKGLRLLVQQQADMPRFIHGDPAKLRQILINLLSNGVKFTKKGSVCLRLEIAEMGPDHIILKGAVEDTGIGIAQGDQQRIFLPFEQLVDMLSQKGTGLGLAITRKFISMMDGSIEVQSCPGKGSLFSFTLKLAPGKEEAMSIQPGTYHRAVALEAGQPEWRILIAEDQEDNLLLLKSILEGAGFKVLSVKDGVATLAAFESWRPHFIWMDWRMPQMDGLETTCRIRQLPGGKEVKIAIITASVFDEHKNELLSAGCDDFVRKPFNPGDILDCLARHLNVRYR